MTIYIVMFLLLSCAKCVANLLLKLDSTTGHYKVKIHTDMEKNMFKHMELLERLQHAAMVRPRRNPAVEPSPKPAPRKAPAEQPEFSEFEEDED